MTLRCVTNKHSGSKYSPLALSFCSAFDPVIGVIKSQCSHAAIRGNEFCSDGGCDGPVRLYQIGQHPFGGLY